MQGASGVRIVIQFFKMRAVIQGSDEKICDELELILSKNEEERNDAINSTLLR